jgi:hypothetical protein
MLSHLFLEILALDSTCLGGVVAVNESLNMKESSNDEVSQFTQREE